MSNVCHFVSDLFSCLSLSPVSPARLGRVTGGSSDRTHSFETTCVCSAHIARRLFRFAHPTSLCHAFAWPDFLCLFFACDFALILFCLFYFCLPISPVLPKRCRPPNRSRSCVFARVTKRPVARSAGGQQLTSPIPLFRSSLSLCVLSLSLDFSLETCQSEQRAVSVMRRVL